MKSKQQFLDEENDRGPITIKQLRRLVFQVVLTLLLVLVIVTLLPRIPHLWGMFLDYRFNSRFGL